MYPHPNPTMHQYTQHLRSALDAVSPFSIQWVTQQYLDHGFQVALNRRDVSDKNVAEKLGPLREALEASGIPFRMNEHTLLVSFDTPEIETKLQRLLDAHKEAIVERQFKLIENDWSCDPTHHQSPLHFLSQEIPRNVDGTVMDPEKTAKALATQRDAIDALAKDLGVSKTLAALTSPRTGRSRAVGGDDASGD